MRTLLRIPFGTTRLVLSVVLALGGVLGCGAHEAPAAAIATEQSLLPTSCTAVDGCVVATLSTMRTINADQVLNNSGPAPVACVGNGDGVASGQPALGPRRALLQFALPSLPGAATLRGVVLSVQQVDARQGGAGGGNDGDVGAYEINAPWDPGTNASNGFKPGNCGDTGTSVAPNGALSWTDQPSVNPVSASWTFGTANTIYRFDSDLNAELLNDVVGWYATPATNHGWLLQMTDESVSDTSRKLEGPELWLFYEQADGGRCNDDAVCANGHCVGGVCCAVASCDDAASCTTDSCSTGVCTNTRIDSACDDSNACTDDTCDPSSGTADSLTGCVHANDDTNSCADGLDCNGSELCSSGLCVPGATTDCTGLDDMCNIGACTESGGVCVAQARSPVPVACQPREPDAGVDAGNDAGTVPDTDAGGMTAQDAGGVIDQDSGVAGQDGGGVAGQDGGAAGQDAGGSPVADAGGVASRIKPSGCSCNATGSTRQAGWGSGLSVLLGLGLALQRRFRRCVAR